MSPVATKTVLKSSLTPEMRQRLRAELGTLLATRALAFRSVTLASGKTSDYYLDCKTVTLHPRGLYLCSALLYDLLSQSALPQGVGGPTLGADPLTAGIILEAEKQQQALAGFIIRKEPKKHGTQKWLEGCSDLPQGANLAIVEDVITTAGSSLQGIERVLEAGYRVDRVLCIVDREEGGQEALAAAGYSLQALFTGSEIKKIKDKTV